MDAPVAKDAGPGPGSRPGRLDHRVKGIPLGADLDAADVASLGWHLTDERTATPVAVLHREAVRHNVAVVHEFCARHDVLLAPHAKTTMSPELVRLQLEAGAWGASVAVPHQAAVLLGWGVRRVLVANEIVDAAALRWLAGRLAADAGLELLWYVDDLAGVEAAERAFAAAAPGGRRGRVLVELGHPAREGGRTGARTVEEAARVAAAVHASAHLEVVGAAGYEGTVAADRGPESLARVRAYLERLGELYRTLAGRGLLAPSGPRLVSAGGSAFFDEVADVLGPLRTAGADVVLRSGCYLTHDHGLYERLSPAGANASPGWPLARLRPALEVWGTVVSRPEPGLALLNLGRRDVSHDQDLPVPVRRARRGGPAVPAGPLTVTALADQHAFVAVPPDDPLAVGDLVGVGVSHPCTTFDRWPALLVLDGEDRVVDVVTTAF